ncbi:methyltransferase domain-containing protein [Nitrospina sp. 32_T5]|uniref:methyltransferase domain-containing protein n=1 Tax=unclassified Nitrospina TaxID=2638683 RepID=UPI003F9B7A7F
MNERRSEMDTEAKISHDDVREFYSKAAATTQENLCCPVKYDPGDLSHIPEEVLGISYGCGSPVSRADIQPGETMVDLGCGGGIDCFIAARGVGETGRVIGVDMTEEMLNVARKNAGRVAENLGYNNLEFHHGFLEAIPVEDNRADVITSNCVVNLSPSKRDVFQEIRRILKPGGRFVIADIVSDQPVPAAMRENRELWGECVSGALTLDEFLDYARQAGFHGFLVTKDYLWKEVEGIRFYSYLLAGYKPLNIEESCCSGNVLAIYAGPFNEVTCEGITFPVGRAVEIKEELGEVLSHGPYRGLFNIIDPETEQVEDSGDDSCCG